MEEEKLNDIGFFDSSLSFEQFEIKEAKKNSKRLEHFQKCLYEKNEVDISDNYEDMNTETDPIEISRWKSRFSFLRVQGNSTNSSGINTKKQTCPGGQSISSIEQNFLEVSGRTNTRLQLSEEKLLTLDSDIPIEAMILSSITRSHTSFLSEDFQTNIVSLRIQNIWSLLLSSEEFRAFSRTILNRASNTSS